MCEECGRAWNFGLGKPLNIGKRMEHVEGSLEFKNAEGNVDSEGRAHEVSKANKDFINS